MAVDLELDLRNPSGLHARPAAVFVRAAAGFRSDIRVTNLSTGSSPATAKSLIAILGLGVLRDHRIRLTITGEDEDAAAAALGELVAAGLGEPVEPERPGSSVGG